MSTASVYVVMHVRELPDDDEDTKMIGVYLSELEAQRAVERLRLVEGFRYYPDGFSVDRYELNKDHWTEGFISWAEALKTSKTQCEVPAPTTRMLGKKHKRQLGQSSWVRPCMECTPKVRQDNGGEHGVTVQLVGG
jgi:hypothetical protein